MNRRYFLMGTAALGGSFALKGLASPLASPNDTIRIACVGVRQQGNRHLTQLTKMHNVEVAAICDVDESILKQRIDAVQKTTNKRPIAYTDVRKLLEDKSIDAITLATPGHWHTLMTVWACQAGKDVYCEKPGTHNMFESKQIVAAARKYNRLVQHGTYSRSGLVMREGIGKLREGVIGEVYMARGVSFKRRETIGRTPVEPVPAGVHYDLWLGPAPKREFTKNRYNAHWHWFWDYGNGDLGNQGIHWIDLCRWGLGVKYPHKVSAIGGKYMFDDDQETPNTIVATYEFNEGGKNQLMVFEVRHWITDHEAGIGDTGTIEDHPEDSTGGIFYGSKGYMAIDGDGEYRTYLGKERQPGPRRKEVGKDWEEDRLTYAFDNFIGALRSRKQSDLNAEIEEGAISCNLIHLANISYRVGRTLNFDSKTMRVVGDNEASALYTRNYRAPFVVPEKV
jgi:predicted dehydrogenase